MVQSGLQMALQEYFSSLLLSLHKFRETDFLCDTVLVTDDKHQLKAHSVVLAAASSVFRTAFAATADRGPGPLQVNLREYESDVVEIALQFIYTGKLLLLPASFEHKCEWSRLVAVVERLGLDLRLFGECEKTFQQCVSPVKKEDEHEEADNHSDTTDDALVDVQKLNDVTEIKTNSGISKKSRNDFRKKSRHKMVVDKLKPSRRRNHRRQLIATSLLIKQDTSVVADAHQDASTSDSITTAAAADDHDKQLNDNTMSENTAAIMSSDPSAPSQIFVCAVCGRSFSKKERLTLHERTHTGERPYKCETCGRRFSLLGNLRRHLPLHSTQKPFMCELCGRTFIRRAYLNDHLAVHATAHPYACSACPKRFNSAGQLRLHFRFVHDGGQCAGGGGQSSGSGRGGAAVRPWFPCDICNKSFTSKGNLKTHSRTHTGEKPFVCACGKAYAQRVQLVQHSYMHSDERPFSCSVCTRSFRFRASLVVHARTHTGERPHICEWCGKSYTNKAGLRTHTARMHDTKRDLAVVTVADT